MRITGGKYGSVVPYCLHYSKREGVLIRAIKEWRSSYVQLYWFLTLPIVESEWVTSRPGYLYPRERAPSVTEIVSGWPRGTDLIIWLIKRSLSLAEVLTTDLPAGSYKRTNLRFFW